MVEAPVDTEEPEEPGALEAPLVPPDACVEVEVPLGELLVGRDSQADRTRIEAMATDSSSDDRVRWMRDHVRVIFENDRPTKMRGIMVDVTEQKKAEEALQEEREVSLRAARVKSEFLANMSHEIRTPLNAIVGMSSLALECRVDHEARDCLSTVKTAADSLLMLVNDILDFSKIEAGGVRLELSDFRLRTLVKNAMDVVQPQYVKPGGETPTEKCFAIAMLRPLPGNKVAYKISTRYQGQSYKILGGIKIGRDQIGFNVAKVRAIQVESNGLLQELQANGVIKDRKTDIEYGH